MRGQLDRLGGVAGVVLVLSACANLQRGGAERLDRCEMVEQGGACVLWGPSLVELIARPEAFDGKRVRVIGFVNFEFEGNGIYLSELDWRNSIYKNGLWIDPPARFETDSGSSASTPNQRYVLVEATFRAGRAGHFGMWSGTLERVTRLQPWGRIDVDTIKIMPLRPDPA